MGIDKPDVPGASLGPPDSPEAYYQEAGRAGRDGNACYAGIIYQQQDLDRIRESVLGPVSRTRTGETGHHAQWLRVQLAAGAGQRLPFRLIATRSLLSPDWPLTVNNALQVLQQQGFLYQ